MPFVPHKGVHAATLGETLGQVTFMLPDALGEVGGDAHVQRTVLPARKEVDAEPAPDLIRGVPLWVPAFAGTTTVVQKGVPPRQIWDDSCSSPKPRSRAMPASPSSRSVFLEGMPVSLVQPLSS